jgi:uncharacterized protein (TIGR03437 family)
VPAAVAVDDPATFAASVSAESSGPPITGSIAFYLDAIFLASAVVQNVNGMFLAGVDISFIASGVHQITCEYGGDGNYSPSTSPGVSVFFGAGRPVVTLSSSLNPSVAGQNVSITVEVAVAEAQLAFATGSVVLKDAGTAVATLTLQGLPMQNAMAVYTTDALSPGRHTFTASYSGDQFTAPGDSTTPIIQLVTQNASVTTITAATPNPIEYGQTASFSVEVDAPKNVVGLPPPTGMVSLVAGQRVFGNAQLLQGKANITVSGLLPGRYLLTANYGGDANYGSSMSVPVNFEVTQAIAAIQISASPDPVAVGAPVALTAVIHSNVGMSPTGTVSFLADNILIGSPVSIASSTASLSTTSLSSGTHVLVAAYSGDLRFSPSTSMFLVENVLAPIVVSSATGFTTVATDSIASIYGLDFTTTEQSANRLPLPLTLAGVSVTIQDSNGTMQPVPLIFASPGQVNCVLPASVRAGPANIAVTTSTGQLQMGQLEITPVAPGIYSADGSGGGPAVALAVTAHADGSHTESPVFHCSKSGCDAVPIDVGASGEKVVLVLSGTGIRNAASGSVKVAIGDETLIPVYAGAQSQFPGLDQVNVALPKSLAGKGQQNVFLVDGDLKSNVVIIALK